MNARIGELRSPVFVRLASHPKKVGLFVYPLFTNVAGGGTIGKGSLLFVAMT
jgi:hypothetical protein